MFNGSSQWRESTISQPSQEDLPAPVLCYPEEIETASAQARIVSGVLNRSINIVVVMPRSRKVQVRTLQVYTSDRDPLKIE